MTELKKFLFPLLVLSWVAISVCAFSGAGMTHEGTLPQKHHASVMECCAVVFSGVVLATAYSARAYFATLVLVLIFPLLIPSKVVFPIFHPPKR